MYSRIFKRFLVVSGQLPCKYESVIKSHVGISPVLLQNAGRECGRNAFAGIRHCKTAVGPNKDALSQKKIDEWRADPENEKQWKVLQLEVDVHRQNGHPVPNEIKTRHWLELIMLESRNKRR